MGRIFDFFVSSVLFLVALYATSLASYLQLACTQEPATKGVIAVRFGFFRVCIMVYGLYLDPQK